MTWIDTTNPSALPREYAAPTARPTRAGTVTSASRVFGAEGVFAVGLGVVPDGFADGSASAGVGSAIAVGSAERVGADDALAVGAAVVVVIAGGG